MLDYPNPHKAAPLPFAPKEYLLLGAGPVNCSGRVLRALCHQTQIPISEDIYQIMDEVKTMTQYVFQTKNRLTLVGQCSGNGGNETILTNLLDRGEKLVVAVGGVWGEKVVDMAKRHNLDVLALKKPPGEVYSVEELEKAIVEHGAKLLFVTHGESTGGTLQPLEKLGAVCHRHGCLLAVDAVVSIAVDPLFVDRWEVDAVNAGSQKAIGAPPGMCFLSFSARAEQKMKEKKFQPPYYYDVLKLGQYWNCFEGSRIYHYTLSSNMLSAVREALATICEEGLEQIWKRHKLHAELFWNKLDDLGLESYVQKRENRFHGVTCVILPNGVDQMKFLALIKKNFRIEITPGYGPTANMAIIRVGLLGQNSCLTVLDYLVGALRETLRHFGK